MTYIPVNKANTHHKSRDDNGREIARYSRYETGVIDGRNRELLAVIADQAGFDGMGFDASIGSGDDSWHVANVFGSNGRYIDTMVIGGAFDSLHAKQVADSQLHRLRGDNCVIVTNPQFDSLSDDKPDTWSLDAINKLLANPSQNKSYLPVITAQELNTEAERVTFDAVQWDSMDGLISHGGSDSALFLDLTRADGHKQLTTPLNLARELELLGAEEDTFDALMDKKVRLTLLKDRLFNAMSRAGDAELSVTNVTETKPFKRQGVTNIAFVFDLSDGQKLSIWFHNPDSTPSQLKADDVMISWKWMLNKRDVTAVLSPNQGDNVQLPVLAARIMRVARKNSKKFKAAQARAAALEKELQDAQALVEAKQGEIDQLDTDIASLNAAIDAAMVKKAEEPTTPPEMTAKEQKEQRERERVLAMQFDEVTQFYKNNGAEPSAYANDIMEKVLAKRLESIRANADFVEYLAPFDTYSLLSDKPEITPEPQSDAPIVITGQEIEVGEEVDFKTAKNNAMAYFDKNLKDKTVFCQAIDSDVLLRRRGGKHIAKANNTFREKLKLVAAIPEMIKQGKYGHYTALNKEKGSNIAGYYVLNVEVKVGDVLKAARVVLEKNNEGEVLYDIGINKKEALAALGDTTSSIMLDGFTESSQYQGLLGESYQVNGDEVNQFDKLTTDNTVILNLFFDADADVINNKAIIEGRINESTTVNGTKVVSNFALVEAKELITSHDALGVANPDFPQELQPRDRSDKKSVNAIKLNAKNLQPEKLGDTEYAGNGAPIIGDDFLVESGNGRAIAIKSAYDNGDAGKYKEWLVNNATDFGLSADDVNGYNQPVLVRVRKTEIDRVEFAIEANLDANPSPLDDAAAQAIEPEAVEEPADSIPSHAGLAKNSAIAYMQKLLDFARQDWTPSANYEDVKDWSTDDLIALRQKDEKALEDEKQEVLKRAGHVYHNKSYKKDADEIQDLGNQINAAYERTPYGDKPSQSQQLFAYWKDIAKKHHEAKKEAANQTAPEPVNDTVDDTAPLKTVAIRDDDDLTDAPASDDNSELSKQLADLESTVNAEDFNPADFDTKGFIELVTATADDAELTARVMAISSVYQQKLVAASMAAMTSLAGGA